MADLFTQPTPEQSPPVRDEASIVVEFVEASLSFLETSLDEAGLTEIAGDWGYIEEAARAAVLASGCGDDSEGLRALAVIDGLFLDLWTALEKQGRDDMARLCKALYHVARDEYWYWALHSERRAAA